MQGTPWRHVIAVSVMAMVLVTVLMYCITPDVMDAVFSVGRSKARQFIQSTFSSRTAAAPAPAANQPNLAAPESPRRVRKRRRELVELRTGPNPFRPYVWSSHAAAWFDSPPEHAPEILDGLALLTLVGWVRRRGKRVSSLMFEREERMAASLARAMRQMEF